MYLYEKENKPEVLCHKTLINNKVKRENVQWSFVSLPFCFNPKERNGFLAKYSSILSLAYLKKKIFYIYMKTLAKAMILH